MAKVTVFVDDAVLGRLPPVCVIDGVPTGARVRVSTPVGGRTGLGVAWLLFLLGPLGWLGLLVVAALRGGDEMLTVVLPYSDGAQARWKGAVSARIWAIVVLIGSAATGVGLLTRHTIVGNLLAVVAALVACAALGTAIVESGRVKRATVHVGLDGSRRWVTLSPVHTAFAAALQGQRQDATSR